MLGLGTVKLSHCTYYVKLTLLKLNLKISNFYTAFAVYYIFSQNAPNSYNCLSEEHKSIFLHAILKKVKLKSYERKQNKANEVI